MIRPLARLGLARVGLLACLLVACYLAGTLAPRVSAADSSGELVREVKAIRIELQGIRRALEKR